MHIRAYTHADLDALRRMHAASRMPYAFPDLANPLFLTRIVIERDAQIVAAALLRLTAEAYVLLDPAAGTPRDRWRALLLAHEAARGDANRRGFDDAHCWYPPPPWRPRFGRRLERLGWRREPWPRTAAAWRPPRRDCEHESMAEISRRLCSAGPWTCGLCAASFRARRCAPVCVARPVS